MLFSQKKRKEKDMVGKSALTNWPAFSTYMFVQVGDLGNYAQFSGAPIVDEILQYVQT